MKRLSASVLACSLLLASCGGGDGDAVACEQQYWDGTVAACLPAGWQVVDRETLQSRGVPEEVIAAFQAEEPVSGQFPMVTVTRETLQQAVDSPAYSQASMRSVAVLPGYNLLDSRRVTIAEEQLDLHVFSAQPVAEEPARRFYQISAVSGNAGYTITGLTPLSVSNTLENQVLTILRSFGFSEPTE